MLSGPDGSRVTQGLLHGRRSAPVMLAAVFAAVAVRLLAHETDACSGTQSTKATGLTAKRRHGKSSKPRAAKPSPLHLVGAEVPLHRLASYLVDNLALRTYPGDQQYFDDGFRAPGDTSWELNTAPGDTAAVLATYGGPAATFYRSLAIATFTDTIDKYQQPNGSFATTSTSQSEQRGHHRLFGVELGQCLPRVALGATRRHP